MVSPRAAEANWSIPRKRVAYAMSDNVMEWLKAHRLEAFAQALADFGVENLEDLKDVTEDDLVKMGMRELQVRRFLATTGAMVRR